MRTYLRRAEALTHGCVSSSAKREDTGELLSVIRVLVKFICAIGGALIAVSPFMMWGWATQATDPLAPRRFSGSAIDFERTSSAWAMLLLISVGALMVLVAVS